MATLNIRPKILLSYGRVNQPLRVPLSDLYASLPNTFLTANTDNAAATLPVKNTDAPASVFDPAITTYALIGEPGSASCELIEIASVTQIQITLAAPTVYPHSFQTPVRIVNYDEVELSAAPTEAGVKTIIAEMVLTVGSDSTDYDDADNSAGFYFARFHNSADDAYSPFSDPVPAEGYTLLSARSVIDAARNEINKENTTEVLSDDYAFQQLDACQTECLREQKRWMFMQEFNAILGRTETGTWRVAVPTDLDDKYTNKSLWNARIGKQPDMRFVDKEKWDELTSFVAWTTLAADIDAGDLTVTLEDSSDFDDGGSIQVGAVQLSYTANDRDTGILTLEEAATADDEYAAGQDVFQGASLGEPAYWTIFNGYLWHFPITGPEFNNRNIYQDYYKRQTRIRRDSDELVIPDPTVAMYYLEWKFLRKMNNGQESVESAAARDLYVARREKMKQKDSIGRTFRLKPQKNSLNENIFPGDDPKYVRDGAFPNI